MLMVASHFPPRNSAGVFRSLRFARYLPELGWQVDVLTISPDCYPDETRLDPQLLLDLPDCVDVHRTSAIYPLAFLTRLKGRLEWLARFGRPGNNSAGRGVAAAAASGPTRAAGPTGAAGPMAAALAAGPGWYTRFKDMISLPLVTPDPYVGWAPFAVRAGRRLVRARAIDVIYSSGPPWTNHLVGRQLKRITGVPWLADFRDPWVNADFKPWRLENTWIGRRHQRLERLVLESADRVVFNTQRSLEDYQRRYGSTLSGKFALIPNGFDPRHGSPAPEQADPKRCELVLAHAGSFYGKRNVDVLIRAIAQLSRQGKILPGDVKVRLIGASRAGRDHERALVRREGVESFFDITPGIPHHECLQELAAADALLVVQVGAPLSIPGKVYEYMALGKLMFVLASPGATTDLAEREQLGVCVSPDDEEQVASSLLELCRRHQSAGGLPRIREEVRARYDGRYLTGELHALVLSMLERRR